MASSSVEELLPVRDPESHIVSSTNPIMLQSVKPPKPIANVGDGNLFSVLEKPLHAHLEDNMELLSHDITCEPQMSEPTPIGF